jgi:hypothetical protein
MTQSFFQANETLRRHEKIRLGPHADCNALVQIADVLGREADARELRARAQKYGAALRNLWDDPGSARESWT